MWDKGASCMNITIDTIKDLIVLVGFVSMLTGGGLYIKSLSVNNKARAREQLPEPRM